MIVTGENGLGHESAGVVVQVGEQVTGFKPGDRVAMECSVPCSKPTCSYCRTGKYHACPEVVFFSTPPHHGTMRRYHVHPEAWLHKLPDSVSSFEEGALLEPLAVALAGIDRAGVRLADPVVICGAGPIGLVTLLAAAAAGAEPIVVTDLDEGRLKKAKEIVPRVKTVLVERGLAPVDVGAKIVNELGMEARVVLECTGVESSIHSAVYVGFPLSFFFYFFLVYSGPDSNADVLGYSVWWHGLCYWCWERYPEYPLHAHVRQGDRFALPVPLS